MNKTIFQLLIVVPALVGSIMLSFDNESWEVGGWTFYLISDFIGIVFFLREKMLPMAFQFIIFALIALNAIYQRLGDLL
jgi:nicotinamide riboside transporter PnuC|tara:strand:- start:1597 stop:1833 length:237 start_codon:yes stop_codon:yes gene_type:complete